MAHIIICKVCGEKFDTDKEQAVYVGHRRYAHQACQPDCTELVPMKPPKEKKKKVTEEKEDTRPILDCCQELFGDDANYPLIQRQIKKYLKEGYSVNGIVKTLKYFYEIKKNPVARAKGSIAIVEYMYKEAEKYYYALWLAQLANQEKDFSQYQYETKEIEIFAPEKKIKKKKLFNFEEE